MSPRTSREFERVRGESQGKILHAAMVLFSKKGFYRSSVDDIAKRAKISKGLVYHYFPSKDAILDSLMEQAFDTVFKIPRDLPANEKPSESIGMFIDDVYNQLRVHPAYWQLLFSMMMQPDLKSKIAIYGERFRKRSVQKIQGLFETAGSKTPKLDAMILDMLFDGVWLNYFSARSDLPLEKLKSRIKTIFMSLHTLPS